MAIQRRNLLRAFAIGGGTVITVKSLPENWIKPVVDSVVLPVHAQTSAPIGSSGPTIVNYSVDMAISDNFTGAAGPFILNYDVTGITPTSDATLDITDLIADVENAAENVAVSIDSTPVGTFFGGGGDNSCPTPNSAQLIIPQATLVAAAADGTVTVTLTPTVGVGASCLPTSGTLTLAFTGATP